MKNTLAIILTCACAALCAVSCAHAQTTPANPPGATMAPEPAANPPAITPADVANFNKAADALLPLVPSGYVPIVEKIIGWLLVVSGFGRLLKSFIAMHGSIVGTLWHFTAGILFNHTPTPPAGNSGGGTSPVRGPILLVCLGLAALCFTGCKSEQMLNNTTGDGANIHLIVPIPGTTSSLIEASLQMGIYKNTSLIQPTSSNKVYTASVAITSKTQQADTIAGGSGVGTNATAQIAAGARDVNVLTIGTATVTDGTNAEAATANQ